MLDMVTGLMETKESLSEIYRRVTQQPGWQQWEEQPCLVGAQLGDEAGWSQPRSRDYLREDEEAAEEETGI